MQEIHADLARLGLFQPKSSLGRILDLVEAFVNRKKQPGTVPFKHSTINDSHIRDLVDMASQKLGISAAEIDASIHKEIAFIEDLKKYSYLLYDTAAKNAIEQAAFELVKHIADNPDFQSRRVMFNEMIFWQLAKAVQNEHRQFRPVRAPGEIGTHKYISPILIPSTKQAYKKWNTQVPTAAATPNGEFIFNKNFMQELLDFAVVENLKPPTGNPGRKYVSNGGPIPDAYAYLEFLILHELLHYTYGDFKVHKNRAVRHYSHQVHNFATDFRSNYLLVKSGYPQLPLGLFSDHLNYDRQQSYEELCRIVKDELDKLPKPLKDEFEKKTHLDTHEKEKQETVPYKPEVGHVVRLPDGSYGQITSIDTDGSFDTQPLTKEQASKILGYPEGKIVREHHQVVLQEGRWTANQVTWMKPVQQGKGPQGPQGPKQPQMAGEDPPADPNEPQQPQQPGDKDQSNQPQQPGDKDQSNQPQQPGDKDQSNQPSSDQDSQTGEPGDEEGEDIDLDALHREIEDNLSRDVANDTDAEDHTKPGPNTTPTGATDQNLQSLKQRSVPDIKSKISWRRLMATMFQASLPSVDTSYSRQARSGVSRLPAAQQLGAMAIKPGERVQEERHLKICLVFDTSGSMMGDIPKALSEARTLVKQMDKKDYPIGVVFFSDSFKWFKMNLSSDTYSDVDSLSDLYKPMDLKNSHRGWQNALSQSSTGGTNFSPRLANDLGLLAGQGWNIIVFSDNDICYNHNWKNFSNLWRSHKEKIYFIADSANTFKACCIQLGLIPKTWTHM